MTYVNYGEPRLGKLIGERDMTKEEKQKAENNELKRFYGDAVLHANKGAIGRKFTLAIVYNLKYKTYGLGYSILNPIDNYSRKFGRIRALGKAKSKSALFVPVEVIKGLGGTNKTIIKIKENIDKSLKQASKHSWSSIGMHQSISTCSRNREAFLELIAIIETSIPNS